MKMQLKHCALLVCLSLILGCDSKAFEPATINDENIKYYNKSEYSPCVVEFDVSNYENYKTDIPDNSTVIDGRIFVITFKSKKYIVFQNNYRNLIKLDELPNE